MDTSKSFKKNNKKIGNLGEMLARKYLTQIGYTVLESNYRCPKGEIDIIAKENVDTIVFVEVKTRTSSRYGQPFEAVDYRKIQRLYTVAQFYICEKELKEYKYRFDIVSITLNNRNIIDLNSADLLNDKKINNNIEECYSISLIKNVIN